jgi:hypothetical protein
VGGPFGAEPLLLVQNGLLVQGHADPSDFIANSSTLALLAVRTSEKLMR